MRWKMSLTLAACVACSPAPEPEVPIVPDTDLPVATWTHALPVASRVVAPLRGLSHQRAVFHLHSPWSHDACDGKGYDEGVLDVACLADLREALCTTHFDVAFLTDHPDYGDAQPFDALFHHQEGDGWEEAGGARASVITCADGHKVRWRAGFEDELMPVGLNGHVHDDVEVRHGLLNGTGSDSVAAMQAAGAKVMLAHTESRESTLLHQLQDAGLHAVEAFNVHAMFSPDIREDHLGLDGTAWLTDAADFFDAGTATEPDLYFLTVLQEQAPSIAHWDDLLSRGPMMATAGTDAHQNVLPLEAKDGERIDSYRRMLRWFSTFLQTDGSSLEAIDAAVEARRAFVVFEAIGTPTGFDFHLEAGGEVYEMGSDAPAGTLVVACPELSAGSPRGEEQPELRVTVYKDGVPWKDACGRYEVEGGVYRVRVESTPYHLRPFLGEVAERYLKPYPWIYGGAIRVVR
jgi:hypothetical protein